MKDYLKEGEYASISKAYFLNDKLSINKLFVKWVLQVLINVEYGPIH